MSITAYIFRNCLSNEVYYVDFPMATPQFGEFWSFTSSTGTIICGENLGSASLNTTLSYTGGTNYTDCLDCLESNTSQFKSFVFSGCDSAIIFDVKAETTFYGENFLPNTGFTYFLEVTDGATNTLECMTFISASTSIGSYELVPSNYTPYTDCTDCANRGRIVTVLGCDGNEYYVELPTGVVNGSLILINILGEYEVGQICAVVTSDPVRGQENASFVQDYGIQSNGCEYCSSEGANPTSGYVKRILTSCLDGSEIVVDVSSLYSVGQSVFISVEAFTSTGLTSCFQIGEETTEPLTYTSQITFEPIQSCQDCIDCNGAFFTFSSCTDGTTGVTSTRQYIELGNFYNDPLSGCSEVIRYELNFSGSLDGTPIVRTNTFSSCTDCDSYVPDLWIAQPCGVSAGSPFVIDMSAYSSPTSGEIYKYEIINTDVSVCFELVSQFTNGYSALTQLHYLPSGNTTYTDCSTCIGTTSYAVALVECGTSDFIFVNIPGINFNEILQFLGENDSVIIKDGIGRCFSLVGNICVAESEIFPSFTPYSLHTDCETCNVPFSAGTPTGICVICCPCTTGETINTVYGPNPTWTNAYGKAIVLLDAIVLGGPNGLNN